MLALSQDQLEQIAFHAEKYRDQDEFLLMDYAVSQWAIAKARINQVRPSKEETKRFLWELIEGAVQSTVKEIASNHQEIATVTMVFATQQLVHYLMVTYQLEDLTPYLIPLEYLAAIFFKRLLEELKKRM